MNNYSLYNNHDSHVKNVFHDFEPAGGGGVAPVKMELVSRGCSLNLVHLLPFIHGNDAVAHFYDGDPDDSGNTPKLTINLGRQSNKHGGSFHASGAKRVYPIPGMGIRFEKSVWIKFARNNGYETVGSVSLSYT